jgi:hypothetical protein
MNLMRDDQTGVDSRATALRSTLASSTPDVADGPPLAPTAIVGGELSIV